MFDTTGCSTCGDGMVYGRDVCDGTALGGQTCASQGFSGGTLTCEHIMRRERSGRWYWTEACFCIDRERSKDKNPPFANIARCDGK